MDAFTTDSKMMKNHVVNMGHKYLNPPACHCYTVQGWFLTLQWVCCCTMSLILLTFISSSTHSDCTPPPVMWALDTQQSTLIGNIQNFITKRKIRSTCFQSSTLKMTANIFLLTKLQINPGSKMTVKKRHRWNRKHEQCFQKQSFLK